MSQIDPDKVRRVKAGFAEIDKRLAGAFASIAAAGGFATPRYVPDAPGISTRVLTLPNHVWAEVDKLTRESRLSAPEVWIALAALSRAGMIP